MAAGGAAGGAAAGLPEVMATPAGAFGSSLVAPGLGQAALGQRRWLLYSVLEAGFWFAWADARSDFRGFRRGYRDLAWEAARIREGPRQDAGWGYYEAMSQYGASGAYDVDSAPGLQPEEDPVTYNGSIWELARGMYLPGGAADPTSPAYEHALAWYRSRAAGPGFLWNWAGREEELNRFLGLIRRAEDARRSQSLATGVILANHLVSAIDALVSARLRAATGADLGSTLIPGPGGPTLRVELRVPLTN